MLLVMVSCQDDSQAERIGRQLLKRKLAACVQVIPAVSSFFLWPPKEGKVKFAEEAILVVKTLESKWEALEKEIQSHHSYENPEVIALPVAQVSKNYLRWLTDETKEEK